MFRRTKFAALAITAILGLGWSSCTQPPAPRPNEQALWHIVHDGCVPNQRTHGDPTPCTRVSLTGVGDDGYVLLKDKKGIAQYLLMPTQRITGIEDAAVLAPGGLNVFALAWDARSLLDERLGKAVPPDFVAVTINSRFGRSQDLLHLHIDCLSQAAHRDLIAAARDATSDWSQQSIDIDGHAYRILRLDRNRLNQTTPFQLLAQGIPGAVRNMGAWTLALVGTPNGRDFYLLAGEAHPASGEWGSAEALQDHDCRIP